MDVTSTCRANKDYKFKRFPPTSDVTHQRHLTVVSDSSTRFRDINFNFNQVNFQQIIFNLDATKKQKEK